MKSVDEVLEAAEERVEEPPSDRLREALGSLVDLPDEERQEAHLRIASALPAVRSPGGAGVLALWVGARVEGGADPEDSVGFVQKALFRWLCSLPEPPEDEGEPSPSDHFPADLLDGIAMLETSLLAHLSRSDRALLAFRENREARALLHRLYDWEAGGEYLLEILNHCSGDLVVLHGSKLKGYLVRYRNLSNCFHLFTLLQGALEGEMPGSRKASREVLAIARGEQSGNATDSAWWHYGQPSLPEANLSALVFGEASPRSIESVDGVQVLLVWPPIMESRSWDGGFFYPRLLVAPPEVTVERELLPEEIAEWRNRLGLSRTSNSERAQEGAKKPWWKFF